MDNTVTTNDKYLSFQYQITTLLLKGVWAWVYMQNVCQVLVVVPITVTQRYICKGQTMKIYWTNWPCFVCVSARIGFTN